MYHCNKISPGSKIAIAKNRKKAANFVDIDQFVPPPKGKRRAPSGTDAASSEKWRGEDGRTSKKTSSPKKMPSPKKTSSPPKMVTPAASATPAPSSSATAASSATARPSAGKPGSAAASSVSKRSHHKNTPCPFQDCEFCGTDPCRHLYVHVKKGELAENSISHIITIASAGDRQFGSEIARKGKKPLRGKQRKWCPVPLCDAIVIDVGRHLVNKSTHGISKDSRAFQRLLRLAKPYTGLAEMEGNLAAPAPPSLSCGQTRLLRALFQPPTPIPTKETQVLIILLHP